MELTQFLENLVSGIAYGSMYGLFAMSIVLLYRTNHLFNFAQTEIATFTVIIMFFLLKKTTYFVALGLAIGFSFLLGIGLHVGVMRVITERKNVDRTALGVITIGMFSIFNSLSFYLFGDEPEPFPGMWPQKSFTVFELNIQYGHVAVLITSILILLGIILFFGRTKLGLVLEAIAENNEAARLRGVRTSNVLALSWGITFAICTFCAIMLAPMLFLHPVMLIHIFAYSLIAIVIGGLESPFGSFVGGLFVGVIENLASNWPVIGSDLKFVAVMISLLVILIVRPRGLWGRLEQRRV